jgi:hypothetical protein
LSIDKGLGPEPAPNPNYKEIYRVFIPLPSCA